MREKILHKATDMFLQYGFKSVTMDDIASEMGISKKTIYAHFDTKMKLVEAVTVHLFEVISKGVEAITAQNLNVIREIFEIKEFVRKHLKDEKSSPLFQLQKYYPKIFVGLQKKQFTVMKECVTDNLERGVAAGLYRPEINIPFIMQIYFCGMMSLKDPVLFPPEKYPLQKTTLEFLDYHLRGIGTSEGLQVLSQIINEKNQKQ